MWQNSLKLSEKVSLMKNTSIKLFFAFSLISVNAFAQSQGYFVEGTLGQGKIDSNHTFTSSDLKDTNWAIKTGYMFNDYVGIEAGYRNLGKTSVTGDQTSTSVKVRGIPLSSTGVYSVSTKTDGWLYGVRFNLPITDNLSAHLRGGFYNWTAKSDISTSGTVTLLHTSVNISSTGSVKERHTDTYWGLGGKYLISKQTYLGVGYSQFIVGDDRHKGLDASVTYSF